MTQGVAARFQGAVGIGTACRSAFGDTLATGDDWGVVKLFRFPCVTPGARCKRYGGHSAQVTLRTRTRSPQCSRNAMLQHPISAPAPVKQTLETELVRQLPAPRFQPAVARRIPGSSRTRTRAHTTPAVRGLSLVRQACPSSRGFPRALHQVHFPALRARLPACVAMQPQRDAASHGHATHHGHARACTAKPCLALLAMPNQAIAH